MNFRSIFKIAVPIFLLSNAPFASAFELSRENQAAADVLSREEYDLSSVPPDVKDIVFSVEFSLCEKVRSKYTNGRYDDFGVLEGISGVKFSDMSIDDQDACIKEGRRRLANESASMWRAQRRVYQDRISRYLASILSGVSMSSNINSKLSEIDSKGLYLSGEDAEFYFSNISSDIARYRVGSVIEESLAGDVLGYVYYDELLSRARQLEESGNDPSSLSFRQEGRNLAYSSDSEGNSISAIVHSDEGKVSLDLVLSGEVEGVSNVTKTFSVSTAYDQDTLEVSYPEVNGVDLKFHLELVKIDEFNPRFGPSLGATKVVDEYRDYSSHLPVCRLVTKEVSNNSDNPWSAEVTNGAVVNYRASIKTDVVGGAGRWVHVYVYKALIPPVAPEGAIENNCSPLKIVVQNSGGKGACRCFSVSNGIVTGTSDIGRICGKNQCYAKCRDIGEGWFADYYPTSQCP